MTPAPVVFAVRRTAPTARRAGGARARGARAQAARLLGAVAVVALVGGAAPAGATAAASGPPVGCRALALDPIPAGLLRESVPQEACDLTGRTVDFGGVRLPVPGPQTSVTYSALGAAGTAAGRQVSVSNDVLGVRAWEPVPETVLSDAGGSVTALGECQDGRFLLKTGSPRNPGFEWSYNPRRKPAYLDAAAALAPIRSGVLAVDQGTNHCGLPRTLRATTRYVGQTTVLDGLSSDGAACTVNDGKDVVGWGATPAGVLASTCAWVDTRGLLSDAVTSADVRFSNQPRRWLLSSPVAGTCGGRYSLRAVATHEVGHAFGLGHGSNELASRLTMNATASPCSDAAATLALGDWNGLDTLYGHQ